MFKILEYIFKKSVQNTKSVSTNRSHMKTGLQITDLVPHWFILEVTNLVNYYEKLVQVTKFEKKAKNKIKVTKPVIIWIQKVCISVYAKFNGISIISQFDRRFRDAAEIHLRCHTFHSEDRQTVAFRWVKCSRELAIQQSVTHSTYGPEMRVYQFTNNSVLVQCLRQTANSASCAVFGCPTNSFIHKSTGD